MRPFWNKQGLLDPDHFETSSNLELRSQGIGGSHSDLLVRGRQDGQKQRDAGDLRSHLHGTRDRDNGARHRLSKIASCEPQRQSGAQQTGQLVKSTSRSVCIEANSEADTQLPMGNVEMGVGVPLEPTIKSHKADCCRMDSNGARNYGRLRNSSKSRKTLGPFTLSPLPSATSIVYCRLQSRPLV